ncbi:MAG: PhoH family protein, partial [Rhodocyclaceae bacterium]|nr:PhoH family protein [Rhodocyclaceae bacterium]
TTPEQMKMFLTRIGIGAKAVVTGDLTQVDLPRGQVSGLREAREVLQSVRGIAMTEFLREDVVRHPLVARIVEAYERRLAEIERLAAETRARASGDPAGASDKRKP